MECETIHFNDQVAIDIGPNERIVAIGIIGACERIPKIKERGIVVQNLDVA